MKGKKSNDMNNPLLKTWETPFGTPPFHLIKTIHFRPAIDEALISAADEIEAITNNPEPPGFENTVAALDRIGLRLGMISSVLFNLNSAETTKDLQAAAQEAAPLLTRFSNDITLNEKLFERIKYVNKIKENSQFTPEQLMLLEKKYRSFLLGGAELKGDDRKRFRIISEELSGLSLKFEENVLDETNAFELHITDVQELAGLPAGIIEMAALEAKQHNRDGWIFTLHYPSYVPFMQYSERRDLREKMLRAYNSRAFHKDEKDNRELVKSIVNLRLEMAKLLGFSNYAECVLGDRMAEKPDRVISFMEELYSESHKAAIRDFNKVKEFAKKYGHTGELERWDWPYYAEKLRKERYDYDDEILRPYFSLENVQDAIFNLAGALFGLSFRKNTYIPVYNDEVSTWEVSDSNGRHLAVLYLDYFPRPGKSGGAWMTTFRDQRRVNGMDIRPLVSIVTNFTRPSADKPSLLTFNEVTTFLHEFGHALHGILSECNYESLSGTNVARDFVELPSQFMENFAFENEWLEKWAVHYQTGEKIPADLVKRIKEASTYNEGYACDRQLGFGFLDMAWHTLTSAFSSEISLFERRATERTELFPGVENTNMSCSFTHIFGGGYAAGYYGYKWAEVLDADAFSFLRKNGLFDSETALSFRKNILEKGGTDKPLNLYIKFRGKEPTLEAFLERSGLKEI